MSPAASQWQPHREPLQSVILRSGTIAVVAGAMAAALSGRFARWPIASLLALWPSFGGHWVEVGFINWLRPRISPARAVQLAARLCVWFLAGIAFAIAMRRTLILLTGFPPLRWPPWWFVGLAFIAIELIAHLALHFRRRPNFYNGLG